MRVLGEILAVKRREVELLRGRARTPSSRKPVDVVRALRRLPGGPLRLIAEVKLRSPSAGALSTRLSAAERAHAYVEVGAAMASVLCDATFFDGSWEHVSAARARLDRGGFAAAPLLAKEFVIDPRQIGEARDRGADAVLLIARIVAHATLSELAVVAREESIEPLIEVVDERELEAALRAGARLVGVNARDLDTLSMDASRAARVCAAIPPSVVAVHLSGLRDEADVARVAAGRTDAALIGEALMREDDPRPLLGAMLEAARPRSPST